MYNAPIKRILVPVDFSDSSLGAFAFAHRLAVSLGASLEIFYVLESQANKLEPSAQQLEAAREEMRRFVRTAPRPGGEASVVDHVTFGDPRERICKTAEDGKFDLIVLGTNGRTGRARMLAGSVAESVVRTSAVPVLTVRLN